MPEQTVTISPTPTLLTQVAGTPVASTGSLTFLCVDGRFVEVGRGSAASAPTVWMPVEVGDGALGRALDQIFPGGSGDHLWARCKSPSGRLVVSWS